jgi:group I intron endonuclease
MINNIPKEYEYYSGIYKITHIPSNRLYIGSASSFSKRIGTHITDFEKNKNSPYMQKVYNKSHKDDFVIDLVELCHDVHDLVKTEQKYLDIYFDDQKICFNIAPTAGSRAGMTFPEKRKYFKFLSPSNEIIEGYGLQEFCKINSLNQSHMSEVFRGKLKSYKGWRSVDNENYIFDRKKLCNELSKNNRFIFDGLFLSPDKKIYGPIDNLSTFNKEHNLFRNSISKLIRKEIKQHKGWTLYSGDLV